jgi:hypothetical protein
MTEDVQGRAELLAITALLDHRDPGGGPLIVALRDPVLAREIAARKAGPRSSDVVQRYAAVITRRSGSNQQSVRVHLSQLIGREQAARLSIHVAKNKLIGRPAPDGIRFRDREVIVLAACLASPRLSLGGLPLSPFADPRVADAMDRMAKVMDRVTELRRQAQYTLDSPSTEVTIYKLQQRAGEVAEEVEKLAEIAACELSRAMPDNATRASALTAMRLSRCLALYTPRVIRQAGWHSTLADKTAPSPGQQPPAKRVAILEAGSAEPGSSPTRYRVIPGKGAGATLLSLYSR